MFDRCGGKFESTEIAGMLNLFDFYTTLIQPTIKFTLFWIE